MKLAKSGKYCLCAFIIIFICIYMAVPVKAEARRVVRVGFPVQEGFTEKGRDGHYSGYTYDYLQELSQYTQWEYEFVEMAGDINESLTALLDMLANGEIDMLGGMTYSDALAEIYDYPGMSYGEVGLVLVVEDDNSELTPVNFTGREMLKIAVTGNGGRQQDAMIKYLELLGQNYELVHCASSEEKLKLLRENKADVMMDTEAGISKECRIIARFSFSPFYLAVTRGNTELLKELNAGMAELKETDPLLIGRLHDEYFNRAASRLIYEENEKSYLAQNKTLRAVVLNGKLPIQNVAAKTGEAEGIAVDFLNYISEETGLTIEYIGITDPEEYRSVILNDQADIILALPGSPQLMEQFGIIHTLPYMNISQILVIHKGLEPGELKGKTAATYDAFGNRDENAGEEKLYYSPEAAMEAVDQGEADYCYIDNYSFQYCINKRVYKNISSIVLAESGSQSISMGVVKDSDLVLHGILNKVIAYMPEATKESIFYESSISQERTSFLEYVRANPLPFAAAVLLLLTAAGAASLHNIRNRYEMSRKMALEYQRYRQLSEVVGECIYEYDFRGDVLKFLGDGVYKLGVPETISAFSVYGKQQLAVREIPPEESLYQWIMEKKDGTKDVQIIFAREPERWYRVTSKVVKDDSGYPVYSIGRVWDIQQEKIEKDRLLQKAQNDGLTGIYNSATIRENITKALNQSSFGGALLIMDIDHFKSINDRYGHSVGDHVLTQVGMKMKHIFKGEIYGRLGGDEFVVFLPQQMTREELKTRVEGACEAFKTIEASPGWDKITVSIGVAVRTDETKFSDLYEKADLLLYEVKREGRNGYRIG